MAEHMEFFLKIKMDGIVEIELQEYDVNELKELINDLRSQDNRAKSLCDKLDKELIRKKVISLPTIIQLSKWCNTSASYTESEPIANKISRLLFNKTLPRLDRPPK